MVASLLGFWLAFTACMAIGQGLLLPTLRRSPPGPEADAHDVALHRWLVLAWLAPVGALLLWCPIPWWWGLVAAGAVRLAVFDPFLNYAAGDPPFTVGRTALTDRALRALAGSRAPVLSAALRVGALLGCLGLLLLKP